MDFVTKGGVLTLSGDSGDVGAGEEQLDVEVSGPDVKVRLNPAYMIDALKHCGGEQATLNWVSQSNQLLVTSPRDPDWLTVIMPIRLD